MAVKISTGLAQKLMSRAAGSVAGAGFSDIFANGVLRLFGGTRPTDADSDESGNTLLLEITLQAGSFTPGSPTNGLNFKDDAVAGTISKVDSETWEGLGLADGTATWYRFYANDMATGSSTTAVRFDGDVGTSADLNMVNTGIVNGASTVISSFSMTLPLAP